MAYCTYDDKLLHAVSYGKYTVVLSALICVHLSLRTVITTTYCSTEFVHQVC